MPKAILLVSTNPSSPEREDEFNAWYDGVHLKDVLAVEGFVSARRFRAVDEDGSYRYLAIYEIDAPDPRAAVEAMTARAGDGGMEISDVLQLDPQPELRLLEQISEAVAS